MSDNAIQSLLDMGIERDVALEALSRTNGDLEASVNYIFSGELPNQHVEDAGIATVEPDTVMTPEVEVSVDAMEVSPGVEDFVEDVSQDERSEYSGSLELSMAQIKEHEADPVVFVPGSQNAVLESYFALFCLALSENIPHYFLQADFEDLNYSSDWYKGHYRRPLTRLKYDKGSNVVVVPQDELFGEDLAVIQPDLLWQFQKFVAVQNSLQSLRRFVTSNFFSKTLEPQVVERLNTYEHLQEVLPSFIKSLANDTEMCPGAQKQIKDLFIFTANYTPSPDSEPIQTYLCLLHFMPEEYDYNLYKMFNGLLFPEEDEDADFADSQNSLCSVAPVLTVIFDEMDESTENTKFAQGVDVPFEFYPQLYTAKAKEMLISDIVLKRRQTQLEIRHLLRNLNDLKSFHGKHINAFVNSALDFASKPGLFRDGSDATHGSQKLFDLLQPVKDQISDQKATIMTDYKKLSHLLNTELNVSNPEAGIIEKAKELQLIDSPYLLTFAALSPSHYYIRKRDGSWYRTLSEPEGMGCNVTRVDHSAVHGAIKAATRIPSETPLMFTFFKESAIDTEELVLQSLQKNQGALSFAQKDFKVLRELGMVIAEQRGTSENLIEM
ncbi:LAMI_0H03928g1_1 [Lachancea mirantina]|uniref:LAMI_0H03928g1_1 n=1 Tax=Lachancea mirantina TaxID=1230905 RepID=A0A1G4KEX0_9SACH|nr:LAMI_0H03928g1_1 [Lachancea mirantina]